MMFTHVMVGSDDVEASRRFYDATLGALGHSPGVIDERGRCWYRTSSGIFAITRPIDGQPASHANGGTIGFAAADVASVDAWHEAGLAHGGSVCEGGPVEREMGERKFYRGYLRDPAGNKICALHVLR